MELTSRKNDIVRRFRELSRDKKLRDAQGAFVAEGDHLCKEAVQSSLEISFALVTERALKKYPAAQELIAAAKGYAVISEDIAEYISDTKAPQGLFAEIRRSAAAQMPSGKLVMLDGVQDPGNVGTIIRTAEALGIKAVLLSPACADVYSPKTLRASMGSVFRLPCITCDIPQMIATLRSDGYSVYGSMLDEAAQRLGDISFPDKSAVVIGSEGSGISDATASACTGGLYIPISGAESLNAAAAASIILWELSK
ncbi:MAG: RNA methyltransferase [Oscillospiraceae bacterium]|nr:RNA methyltransferase [Oscillospiraceae bacterium]